MEIKEFNQDDAGKKWAYICEIDPPFDTSNPKIKASRSGKAAKFTDVEGNDFWIPVSILRHQVLREGVASHSILAPQWFLVKEAVPF